MLQWCFSALRVILYLHLRHIPLSKITIHAAVLRFFVQISRLRHRINNQRSASTLIWIVTAIGFGNFNEDFVALAGPKMLFGGDAKDRWRGEAPIQGKKLNRCDSGLVDIKSGYLRRSDMVPRFARDNCF
ncbi:predicted protein [Brucella melitensis bv. 3 str. Ether]|nr:predicted protein [Brucella melitensis bv. 3 str. Ether]